MEVKNKHPEYNDWKTEKQWLKENKVPIKEDFRYIKPLWFNQWCKSSAIFISPKNVRDMTEEEMNERKLLEEKEKQERKQLKAQGYKADEIELIRYNKKCEEWKTKKEWKKEKRVPKANAKWIVGHSLRLKLNTWIYNNDEWYCHISDTEGM